MIVEGIDDLEYVVMKIGEEMMDFEDEMLGVRSEYEEMESAWKRGFREGFVCGVVMIDG